MARALIPARCVKESATDPASDRGPWLPILKTDALQHWDLRRDPFADGGAGFVSTPVHEEAVARLVHVIEAGHRLATLEAGPGLGKSVVLDEALARARDPGRRIARVADPLDGPAMLAELARGLGRRRPDAEGRGASWRALADAARLCRLQGLGVVLAIDDVRGLREPADRLDLERLAHLDPHPGARLSVLQIGRPDAADGGPLPRDADPWGLAIRLTALSRREAEDYLTAKLRAAGRAGLTFTPRALTRLHALAGGVPRGLDRLAALALMAGAMGGLEVVGAEIIEGVARECVALPGGP